MLPRIAAAVMGIAMLTSTPAHAGPPRYGAVGRLAFNRAAVRLNLPVYWREDADKDGIIDPSEVVALRFYPTFPTWVKDGKFTKAFDEAYAQIVRWASTPPLPGSLDASELERRRLVVEDLDQGRPTLVYHDLRGMPHEHRAFVEAMLGVAGLIDQLYARTHGLDPIWDRIPPDDESSHSLVRRNWSPKCKAPKTENNPRCSAVPGLSKEYFDLYPRELQDRENFCEFLAKQPNAKELLDPFTVVREVGGELRAAPYPRAYPKLMGAIAIALRAASHALAGTDEEALRAYLDAASEAFITNDWFKADEAWAKMNGINSKWYVRVGPDEVYWEPCNRKAGFHLTLALIDPASLEWQRRLKPLQQEMEEVFAKLIGKPYEARKVSFHLPDFIDIVINAGDDRDPFGATIGQSLPNWGPVANEGRGRTVVMSTLYTDPDSLAVHREQAASLLDATAMKDYTDDRMPGLLGTILHEAAHNLGPAHEYKVGGKTDDEIFGGPLASVLEELKAQTASLWYVEFLRRKGVIDDDLATKTYVNSIVWAFGHISRGMYTAEHRPKTYSQLAAIQVGFFLDRGALRFDRKAKAANGKDVGAFHVDFAKLVPAIEELMRQVGQIKARGDVDAARALVKRYVDGHVVPMKPIADRYGRFTRASFVYGLDL